MSASESLRARIAPMTATASLNATPLVLCGVIVLAFDSNLVLLSLDFALLIALGAWAVYRVKVLEKAKRPQPPQP